MLGSSLRQNLTSSARLALWLFWLAENALSDPTGRYVEIFPVLEEALAQWIGDSLSGVDLVARFAMAQVATRSPMNEPMRAAHASKSRHVDGGGGMTPVLDDYGPDRPRLASTR